MHCPARVAGVDEIVMVVPSKPDGSLIRSARGGKGGRVGGCSV